MTAATISNYIECSNPSMEIVKLEASDGETYKSRKFKVILGAIATINFATGEATEETVYVDDASFSTGSVTIELVGTDTTDVPITLVLFGVH